jgi:hypothetical protein
MRVEGEVLAVLEAAAGEETWRFFGLWLVRQVN